MANASRTPTVENNVLAYLDKFIDEYNYFADKVEGKERQRRMKEELRAYTEDASEAVRKKATEVWNAMRTREMGFGSEKVYVSNQDRETISNTIVAGLEPLMGNVADTKSKGFLAAITKGISKLGEKLQRKAGGIVKGLLLPAQDKSYESYVRSKDNETLNSNERMLESPDNIYNISKIEGVKTKKSELFTFQTDHSLPGTPPEEKKYIIRFNGNGEFALHSAEQMNEEAKNHNCVVIGFDYPGVGKSTGSSKGSKDMVEAGLAQVKRLTDMGVKPENIILKGQSIGGGVATLTAAALHEKDQKVHVFNQRSFSKLSDAAKHLLGGGVLGKIAAYAVKKAGWEMDSIKAWNKIPDTHKDFYFAANDKVIPPGICGLAGALGKVDDKSRQDNVGHNDPIYGNQSWGSRSIELWDGFIDSRFGKKLSLNVDLQEQAQQFIKTFGQPAASPSSPLLRFTQSNQGIQAFGSDSEKVLAVLKEIGQGKVTNYQLNKLQALCDKRDISTNGLVKAINDFVVDVKQNNMQHKDKVHLKKSN